MQETLQKIDKEDLVRMAEELKSKSEVFQELLAEDKVLHLSEDELKAIFNLIFLVRRKQSVLLEEYSIKEYLDAFHALLHGKGRLADRFQAFIDAFDRLKLEWRYDMASELLHYTFPAKYWLWNRWMFDPRSNTGAIPLVTNEEFELHGSTYGVVYMKVGKAVAFVHSMAESVEFQFIHRSLFGTDVFLSCVYVIYAYTVLTIKMTDEFNKVMPGLGEFARRILGIYSSKEMTVV